MGIHTRPLYPVLGAEVAGIGPTAPELTTPAIVPAREIDVAWGRAQLAAV